MSVDLSKIGCQEANMHGLVYPGTQEPIPCGRPGAKVVFHQRDGRNVYVMCDQCADHNLRNRGGTELVPAEPTEPDAYCVSQPDGSCTSEDPRCMHNAVDIKFAEGELSCERASWTVENRGVVIMTPSQRRRGHIIAALQMALAELRVRRGQ